MIEEETEMLDRTVAEGETEVLETVSLEAGEPETDVLHHDVDFVVIRSLVEIHTDEVIGI